MRHHAYITRRFDVKQDGSKYLQEDFAQISGRTKKTHGEDYKYNGTYEDIGKLIKEKVAAYPPVLEVFYKLVLFNYVFSNVDAHLKNFSLIQSEFGDYVLTRAYDLMCTVLHTPNESDTALELYPGDMESAFFSAHDFYGKPDFEILAARIGLLPKRVKAIMDILLDHRNEVASMVQNSFLSDGAKQKYLAAYQDKVRRFEL
jgi:serine/threonine-protein kinase HipA